MSYAFYCQLPQKHNYRHTMSTNIRELPATSYNPTKDTYHVSIYYYSIIFGFTEYNLSLSAYRKLSIEACRKQTAECTINNATRYGLKKLHETKLESSCGIVYVYALFNIVKNEIRRMYAVSQ